MKIKFLVVLVLAHVMTPTLAISCDEEPPSCSSDEKLVCDMHVKWQCMDQQIFSFFQKPVTLTPRLFGIHKSPNHRTPDIPAVVNTPEHTIHYQQLSFAKPNVIGTAGKSLKTQNLLTQDEVGLREKQLHPSTPVPPIDFEPPRPSQPLAPMKPAMLGSPGRPLDPSNPVLQNEFGLDKKPSQLLPIPVTQIKLESPSGSLHLRTPADSAVRNHTRSSYPDDATMHADQTPEEPIMPNNLWKSLEASTPVMRVKLRPRKIQNHQESLRMTPSGPLGHFQLLKRIPRKGYRRPRMNIHWFFD